MPWYYAGPEAKPVGPVSLDELQARRARGEILPDTFVIEDKGTGEPKAWQRYRDAFPPLPPVPPPVPTGAMPPLPPAPPPPVPQVNPLFPSAHPVAHHPASPTNQLCLWGFIVGIASAIFSFFCGIGLIFAIPAILLCLLGLMQVQHDSRQTGRGMAVGGMLLAVFALLVSLILIGYVASNYVKLPHGDTITEQTSNDSD